MLQKTKGIVLRSIKYGDSSLVTTVFTEVSGVQSYMVQGVRSARSKHHRAGLLQPGSLLELVVYQQPNRNLQRIREFEPAYIYTTMQEHVVKNSIVLFSVELLLRLLPEHAPMPPLFAMSYEYFTAVDRMPADQVANFPLYFVIQCSRMLGYELTGSFSRDTPYLNLEEGGFTAAAPSAMHMITEEDSRLLSALLQADGIAKAAETVMNASIRLRLIDWYIDFLHRHTQHMGSIRSLSVLRAILH